MRRSVRLAPGASAMPKTQNIDARERAQRYAEIRVDPERLAELKKKRRKYRRTMGKFLHELSQPYHKMAANPEWRERHNAKQRERYRNDPEFRARRLERDWLDRARKKKLGLKGKG